MAALIKQDSGADADLEPGGRGELSVWVDGRKVADKTMRGFPADAEVLTAVKAALDPRGILNPGRFNAYKHIAIKCSVVMAFTTIIDMRL